MCLPLEMLPNFSTASTLHFIHVLPIKSFFRLVIRASVDLLDRFIVDLSKSTFVGRRPNVFNGLDICSWDKNISTPEPFHHFASFTPNLKAFILAKFFETKFQPYKPVEKVITTFGQDFGGELMEKFTVSKYPKENRLVSKKEYFIV